MKKRLPYLLFLFATIIWGFAFVAQKAAIVLPAFTVGAARSGIAAIFLVAVIPFTDRLTKNGRRLFRENRLPDINRHELIGGAILGAIISAATGFQQTGLESTDAGKAAFITALYVVIVPIISSFLGKKPSFNLWIALPMSIVGFYFLCIKDRLTVGYHDVLLLICALLFSCHIIAVDRLSPKCDGVRMSLVQFASALIINTLLALIFGEKPSIEGWTLALPSLLFLGIGSSGIAYTLQILGQKEADPAISSMILSMESVFGVIGAALLLGERMSVREYVGSAIVLVAIFIAQLEPEFIKKLFKKQDNVNNS